MKTILSRYQNVAAGKFEAAQEDIDSENYNEEDWARLNDIETALGALGINIRSSVDTFRDFDDVMEEIASKWDTYTNVQQAGIATSLAGTRQRENVITLFQNWDSVLKFEEISANAYGTAVEKMEAYTDSVEAAQKRVQAAIEKFALDENIEKALTTFYNTLAKVIDNMGLFSVVLAGIIAVLNKNAFMSTLASGLNGLSSLLQTVGSAGYGVGQVIGGNKEYTDSLLADNKAALEAQLLAVQQRKYGAALTRLTAGADEQTKAYLLGAQTALLNENRDTKLIVVKELQAGTITQETVASLQKSTIEQLAINATEEQITQARLEVIKIQNLNKTYDQLTTEQRAVVDEAVKQRLAMQQLNAQQKEYKEAMGKNIKTASTQTSMNTIFSGAGTIFGGIIGASAGQSLGQAIAGDTGSVYGSMLGGLAMSGVGNRLGSVVGNAKNSWGLSKYALKGQGAALQETLQNLPMSLSGESQETILKELLPDWDYAVEGLEAKEAYSKAFETVGSKGKSLLNLLGGKLGIASIALSVGTMIYDAYNQWTEKAFEEARSKFKELKEELDVAQNASVKTGEYDKLAKGVDYLGRNVSLTAEEYDNFLELSNTLAEAFPELVVRTDEYGNKLVGPDGLAGKVGAVTEKVDEFVASLKQEVDTSIFDEADGFWGTVWGGIHKFFTGSSVSVFGEVFDEQSGIISDAKQKLEGYKADPASEGVGGLYRTLDAAKQGMETYSNQKDSAQYKMYAERVKSLEAEIKVYEKQIEDAQSTLYSYTDSLLADAQTNADYAKYSGVKARKDALGTDEQTMANLLISTAQGTIVTENEDDFKEQSLQIADTMTALLEEHPIIADIYYNTDSTLTLKAAQEARESILPALQAAFPNGVFDEETCKILIQMGFAIDENGVIGVEDIGTRFAKAFGVETLSQSWQDFINGLSNTEATVLFEKIQEGDINYDSIAGNKFGFANLQDYIEYLIYGEKTLGVLANDYEMLQDAIENATSAEEKALAEKNFISTKKYLDQYAEQLGGIKGDYDDIIERIQLMGNLTWAGTSEKNPEEVLEQSKQYQELYAYLRDDFDGKNWDAEQLAFVAGDSRLAGLIGDPSALKRKVGNILDDMDTLYNNALQNVLYQSESGTKYLLSLHQDEVKVFAEACDVDLTNYETLKEAEDALQAKFNDNYETHMQDWLKNNTKWYGEDVKLFATSEKQKELMRAWKASGKVEDTGTNEGTISVMSSAQDISKNMGELLLSGGDITKTTAYKENKQTFDEWYAASDEAQELNSQYAKIQTDFQKILETNFTTTAGKYGTKGSDTETELDRLEAIVGMHNKEYYLRKSLLELDNKTAESQDSYMDAAYYEKMRRAYANLATEYYKKVPWTKELKDWSEEEIGYYQKYQEAMVNLNNLDDEQIEDKINILQLENMSYEALISAQQLLIESSDSYEELLERQKEYNNLLKEQLEYQKEIAEWQVEIIDYGLEYEKNSPASKTYAVLMDAKEQALNAQLKLVQDRIKALENPVDDKTKSYAQSMEGLKEIRERYTEQNKIMQELASLPIEILNDKLDEIDRSLDLLKKAEGWGWYEQLDDYEKYYDLSAEKLESKAKYIQEQLNDVSDLTDEEIQTLLDQMAEVFDDQISLQKEYNQRLKEQTDLVKQNADWQKQILEGALEYTSYSPNSKLYTSLMKDKKSALNTSITAVKDRINALLNPTEEMKSYVASQEGLQELQDRYQEYNELVKELASLPLQILNDKLDAVNRSVELLEKSKPEEWSKYGEIDTYYQKNLKYLKEEAELIKESLEDVSSLTDEEIQDLIDKLNDATAGIKEAEINLLEEQKTYKESQYDAVVDVINEYKQNLQDAINEIEKEYEDELKPLQDINEELERQANLEDLLAAKKKANKEKSRVDENALVKSKINRLTPRDGQDRAKF